MPATSSEAKRLGHFGPLTPGEIAMAQEIYTRPNTHTRAWEYWATRLAKRGEMPAAPRRGESHVDEPAPAKQEGRAESQPEENAQKPQTPKGRKRR